MSAEDSPPEEDPPTEEDPHAELFDGLFDDKEPFPKDPTPEAPAKERTKARAKARAKAREFWNKAPELMEGKRPCSSRTNALAVEEIAKAHAQVFTELLYQVVQEVGTNIPTSVNDDELAKELTYALDSPAKKSR